MKFRVKLKTPHALFKGIFSYTDSELTTAQAEIQQDKMLNCAYHFFNEINEELTIEFDTVADTATVIRENK